MSRETKKIFFGFLNSNSNFQQINRLLFILIKYAWKSKRRLNFKTTFSIIYNNLYINSHYVSS